MASFATKRRSWRWKNFLLVSLVLFALVMLSLAAGALAGTGRNTLTLLLIVLPALPFVYTLMAQRTKVFVLLMPLAALAIPFELPTGTDTRLPLVLLMAIGIGGLWIVTMVVRGKLMFVPTLLNKPMLVFSVICCVSLVWGIIWRDPVLIDSPKFIFVQIASLLSFLVSLGAALLIGNYLHTHGQLKFMLGTFLVCGSLMTITELFHINQHFLADRGLWGLWTVIVAYGLLIAQPKLKWWQRLALIVVIIATLYQTAIVNVDWISGWLPTIVALYAATFIRSKKAFVILVVVGAIAGYGAREFFIGVADDNVNDGSLERISLWEQNLRVVREHWLFGTGPAGYAIYYMTYYREDARSTHNNYLDILSQFGVTGMLAWLWLAVAGVWEGWRLSRRAPPGLLRTVATIATAGWVGGQAAMFFGDWILPFAYNQGVAGYRYTVYTWLFLGTLISVRTMLSLPSPEPPVVEPL